MDLQLGTIQMTSMSDDPMRAAVTVDAVLKDGEAHVFQFFVGDGDRDELGRAVDELNKALRSYIEERVRSWLE